MSLDVSNWDNARDSYAYYFDLSQFHRKKEFSNQYFNLESKGDRESTKKFEIRFQINAPYHNEVFIEVLFWKLFSKRATGNINYFDSNDWYNNAINTLKKTSPTNFWDEITNFVRNVKLDNFEEARENYRSIAGNLKIKNKLIIPLTFTSLAYPDVLPMIDRVVISWINKNYPRHNKNRERQMISFSGNSPTIENDFEKYIQWVRWCQDSALILNDNSSYDDWRPRDVEMAIFCYQLNGLGESLENLV
jgi:hypothetical protein